jgi:hypothetical protein
MAVVSRITTIVVSSGTGTRTFQAEAATQDTGVGGSGGSTVGITITQSTGGVTPPAVPDTLNLKIRVDNSATQIRDFSLTPGSANQSVTFFFTANGQTGDTHRFGTLRMRLEAVRTSGGMTTNYTVNSDDTSGEVLPTGWSVTQRDQGWFRGTTTAAITVHKTSLDGEQGSFGSNFTGTYAYNDTVLARCACAGIPYDTAKTVTVSIAGIKTQLVSDPNADGNYDATFTNGIDTSFTEASTSRLVSVTAFQNANLTSQAFTQFDTQTTQTITVDPRVTLDSVENLDSSVNRVYNRGDTVNARLVIVNARGEAFSPIGHDTLKSINASNSAVEETIPYTKSLSLFTFNAFQFATSSNVAPATAGGAAKLVRWRDTTTAGGSTPSTNSPSPADSTQYGLLSSLLDSALHLQVDNNTLDPALNTTQRLGSAFGFFGAKILDRNGNAVNGASGVISFVDDQSFTSVQNTASLTSQTVNGHAGYTPLQPWSNDSPAGLWDFYFSTQFTKSGNTTDRTRQGAGLGDFTLVVADPRVAIICGGGPYTIMNPRLKDSHFAPGLPFQAGMAAIRVDTGRKIGVDSAEVGVVRVQDSGPNIGRAEYLDSDETTWLAFGDGDSIHFFSCTEGIPGSKLYTKTFVSTSGWDTYDIFLVARATIGGAPYGASNQITSVATKNNHGKLLVDPTGLFA